VKNVLPVWVKVTEKCGIFKCASVAVPSIYAEGFTAKIAIGNFVAQFKKNHGLDILPVLQGGAV